jgi:hypothetical protein
VLRGEVSSAVWLAAASFAALISSRRRRTSVGDRRLLPKASPEGLFRTMLLTSSCSNVKTIVTKCTISTSRFPLKTPSPHSQPSLPKFPQKSLTVRRDRMYRIYTKTLQEYRRRRAALVRNAEAITAPMAMWNSSDTRICTKFGRGILRQRRSTKEEGD